MRSQNSRGAPVISDPSIRTLDTPDTPLPRVALLGGAPYSTLVSNAGGGISRYGDIAINRWRVDATRDGYGQWCYLRDVTSGKIWSATHQPVCADTLLYRVTFDDERATFERRDGDFETRTEIGVPTGVGAEMRRVTITNNSKTEKKVELTSYQEVVLAPILSDRGHRAFGNLFVQTEWLPKHNSLLAMRRPRSAVVKPVWGGHTVAVDGNAGPVSCETDRSVFVGRGRTQRNPVVMDNAGNLPGTVGAVLDPVLALRTTLTIPAGQSAAVVFTTFHAVDHQDARRLAEQFSNLETSSKYFESDSVAESAPADTAVYQDLAALLLFGAKSVSDIPVGSEIKADRRDLITLGITGEIPILLARIGTSKSSGRVAELVDLHRYWSLKRVECDLVIITDDTRGSSKLRQEVTALVSPGGDADATKKAGGIFVFDVSELNPKQAAALNISARIQIDCDLDTLEEVANG
jgi:cyclic beta-1,2-glucan synthetase